MLLAERAPQTFRLMRVINAKGASDRAAAKWTIFAEFSPRGTYSEMPARNELREESTRKGVWNGMYLNSEEISALRCSSVSGWSRVTTRESPPRVATRESQLASRPSCGDFRLRTGASNGDSRVATRVATSGCAQARQMVGTRTYLYNDCPSNYLYLT